MNDWMNDYDDDDDDYALQQEKKEQLYIKYNENKKNISKLTSIFSFL